MVIKQRKKFTDKPFYSSPNLTYVLFINAFLNLALNYYSPYFK